jgi:hypothetical protein
VKAKFEPTLLREDVSSLDVKFWNKLLERLGRLKEPLYDTKQREWLAASKYPSASTSCNPATESDFCIFLNKLAETVSGILKLPVVRKFTADYCIARSSGYAPIRKPDITLFRVGNEPKDTGGVALWRCVQSYVEMKNVNSRGVTTEALIQLAGEPVTLAFCTCKTETGQGTTSIMWATQDNRDFIIGVNCTVKATEKKHYFGIVKMDKCGTSRSLQYNCATDAMFLLRLVTGLAMGDSTCLGFTRSVEIETLRAFDDRTNESNPIRKLVLQIQGQSDPVGRFLLGLSKKHSNQLLTTVSPSDLSPSLPPGALLPDTEFHIDEILHCGQSNYGRGTIIWAAHVHRPNEDHPSSSLQGSDHDVSDAKTPPLSPDDSPSPANDRDRYIVKDIWHDANRPYTEGEVLQMLDGLDNVPKFRGEYVPDDYRRSTGYGLRNFLTIEQYQQLLDERKLEERIRLRLVYGPPDGVSDPKARLIYKYENRQEVITALIAIVTGTSFPSYKFSKLTRVWMKLINKLQRWASSIAT